MHHELEPFESLTFLAPVGSPHLGTNPLFY